MAIPWRFWPRIDRRFAHLRRDVAMVVADLGGAPAPPLVSRGSAAGRTRSTRQAARALRVAGVIRETPDAVSLILEDPTGAPIEFVPGQFFTVLAEVDGVPLRRAYSPSSSHLEHERVRITAKRVPGGRVSSYLNETIRAGDIVRVLGPSGDFTAQPDAGRCRHLVLFAGGSGITPLAAILRAILTSEPQSRITLVYGNRSEADIIYGQELADLHRAHAARFSLRHVLSDPVDPSFCVAQGILSRDIVADELEAIAGEAAAAGPTLPTFYYVCGPEPMMAAVREALRARGVGDERIREERFYAPAQRPLTGPGPAFVRQRVTVHFASGARDMVVAPGETLLDAGLAAGIPMEFSCAMGGCGACRVKLERGRVAMEEPNCLSGAETGDGYVLACVSRPLEPAVIRCGA